MSPFQGRLKGGRGREREGRGNVVKLARIVTREEG